MLEVFPHVGVPYHLDLGDRGSVGMMILRQTGEVEGTSTIEASYHVVEPTHLSGRTVTPRFDVTPGRLMGKASGRRKATTRTGNLTVGKRRADS
jgi:hypothetical protein